MFPRKWREFENSCEASLGRSMLGGGDLSLARSFKDQWERATHDGDSAARFQLRRSKDSAKTDQVLPEGLGQDVGGCSDSTQVCASNRGFYKVIQDLWKRWARERDKVAGA